MSAPFVLRVHGRSGHASMPGIADNALVKAAPLVERLGTSRRAPPRPGDRGVAGGDPRRAAACRGGRARGRTLDPSAGRRAARAAARDDGVADDDPRRRAAQRDPVAVRGEPSTAGLLPGDDPRRRSPPSARSSVTATTSWSRSSAGRDAVPARRAAVGRGRRHSSARRSRARRRLRSARPGSRTRTGCARRSAPSPTGSSRHGRPGDGGAADPFRRRAGARRRPRARRPVPAPRARARSAASALGSADAGAARAAGCVRGAGGLPRRRGLLGARGRRRRPLPRLRPRRGAAPDAVPAPPEPCRLPLLACRIRAEGEGVARRPESRLRVGELGAELGRRGLRQGIEAVRAAIARGDVYQVNLVQHLEAPFEGDPAALATALAPLRPLHGRRSRATAGRSSRPRRSVPRAPRPAALDDADQGHAPGGRGRRRPEGRRRARDDRRPRAERPRPRLRAGLDPLAAS